MSALAPTRSLLESRYRFRDEEAVRRFLVEHPELIDILHETSHRVYDVFPQSIRLALEMFEDPEDDAPPLLVVVIETGLSPREARMLLYRFRDTWWRKSARPFVSELFVAAE